MRESKSAKKACKLCKFFTKPDICSVIPHIQHVDPGHLCGEFEWKLLTEER